MSFMIKSDVSEQYLLEEDAVEGFRQAVMNGQVRLALQILVDIVDVFEAFIASVVEDDEESETIVGETSTESKSELPLIELKEEEKVAEPQTVDKKPATKKAAAKDDKETETVAE